MSKKGRTWPLVCVRFRTNYINIRDVSQPAASVHLSSSRSSHLCSISRTLSIYCSISFMKILFCRLLNKRFTSDFFKWFLASKLNTRAVFLGEKQSKRCIVQQLKMSSSTHALIQKACIECYIHYQFQGSYEAHHHRVKALAVSECTNQCECFKHALTSSVRGKRESRSMRVNGSQP